MSKLSEAIEILSNLPKTELYNLEQASDFREFLCILRKVVNYAADNACLHDETWRVGAAREICMHCGAERSDYEGGKPEENGVFPKFMIAAYDMLERYEY